MSLILMILAFVLSIEVPQDGYSFVMQASPDGHMMVRLHGLSPGEDARTYIYDTHTGDLVYTLDQSFSYLDASHGRIAIFDNDALMVLDAWTGEQLLPIMLALNGVLMDSI